MKLAKITIKNFVALKRVSLSCKDLTAIIGENNVGKSSILMALDTFFSVGTGGMRTNYFHRLMESNQEKVEPVAEIECEFTDLTDNEKSEFRIRLYEDKLILQKRYTITDEAKIEVLYRTKSKIFENEFLNIDSPVPNRTDIEEMGWQEFYPSSGKITKEQHEAAKKKIIERNNPSHRYDYVDNPRGFQNQCDKFLPEFHLVPAVREATDELRMTQASKLSGLVNSIIKRIVLRHPSFEKLKQNVSEIQKLFDPATKKEERIPGFDRIADSLSKNLSRHIKATVDLRPAIPDPTDFFKLGMNVSIDDGISGNLDEKGHGLQRTFIVSMFLTYGELLREIEREHPLEEEEEKKDLKPLIFALEEPELYLHPQLQRSVYDSLKDISKNHQVLYCTHSPFFVDLNNYRDITLLKKDESTGKTIQSQCEKELFSAPERKSLQKIYRVMNEVDPKSEMFFARKIVLAEGACEKHCYPIVAKRLGVFNHSVTLVDCGGNDKIPLYQELLNAFQLPYLVVADQDPGNKETEEKIVEIKKLCEEGKGRLLLQTPDFEKATGCEAGSKGKPMRAIRFFSDESNQISEKMKEYAEKIYGA
jgi:CRISPR-associated exonuclease Cas4